MPGSWQRYFHHWEEMTLDRIDPRLLDLVPSLVRLAPPAVVIDKHVYSPFVERRLLQVLCERQADALVMLSV